MHHYLSLHRLSLHRGAPQHEGTAQHRMLQSQVKSSKSNAKFRTFTFAGCVTSVSGCCAFDGVPSKEEHAIMVSCTGAMHMCWMCMLFRFAASSKHQGGSVERE
jgi:hypothetical protein